MRYYILELALRVQCALCDVRVQRALCTVRVQRDLRALCAIRVQLEQQDRRKHVLDRNTIPSFPKLRPRSCLSSIHEVRTYLSCSLCVM